MPIKIGESGSLRLSSYLICGYRFALSILKSRGVGGGGDGGGGGAEMPGEFWSCISLDAP